MHCLDHDAIIQKYETPKYYKIEFPYISGEDLWLILVSPLQAEVAEQSSSEQSIHVLFFALGFNLSFRKSHAVVVLLHMDSHDLEPHVVDLKKAYSTHYCIYLLLSFLGPGCCLFLMSVG